MIQNEPCDSLSSILSDSNCRKARYCLRIALLTTFVGSNEGANSKKFRVSFFAIPGRLLKWRETGGLMQAMAVRVVGDGVRRGSSGCAPAVPSCLTWLSHSANSAQIAPTFPGKSRF